MVLDTYNGMVAQAELEEERLFDSSQYIKFNPDRNTNIGYALNVTYYNTLTTAEKDIIIIRNYNTSTSPSTYEMVNAKIGLLDVFQGTLDNRLLYPAIKFVPSSSDNTRYSRGMTLTPNENKDRIQVIEQSGSTNSIDPDTDVAMPLKYMQLDRTAIVKARRNTKSDNMTSTNVNVVNGAVTVNYSGVYVRILEQKWDSGTHDVSYFSVNGTSFTKTARFEVVTIGDYTIYTKLENGTEYVKTFTVTEDQLPKPYPKVIWGLDRVLTFTWDDTAELPPTVKYAAGEKDIAYFMGGQIGNAVNQPDATNYPKTYVSASTLSTQVGKMTLYIKDIMGKEYVQIFDVTQEMYDPPVTPVFADNETTQSVEFSGLSSPDMIVWKKWDYGQWEASYFDTNGTQIYDNSFVVNRNGWVTLGIRYANFKSYAWKHNAAVMPVVIGNLVSGDLFSLGGKKFINIGSNYVIERNTIGTMKMDEVRNATTKYMDKNRTTSVAYYLNGAYYNGLHSDIKNAIVTNVWALDYVAPYDANTTSMEVGLLTVDILDNKTDNKTAFIEAMKKYASAPTTRIWSGCGETGTGSRGIYFYLATFGTTGAFLTNLNDILPVYLMKPETKVVQEFE